MSLHASAQNVRELAEIATDTSNSILTSAKAIEALSFQIFDEALLRAVFSELASRIDNLSSLADQLSRLEDSLQKTLSTQPPPA